jgi:hypothetical protein
MQDDSRSIQQGAQTEAVPPRQIVFGGIQIIGLPILSNLPRPGTQLFPGLVYHCPQGFRHGGSAPSADKIGGLLR